MEKEDSIKLLARELAKKGLIYFITDEKVRDKLTSENYSAILPVSTLSSVGTADLYYILHSYSEKCEYCNKKRNDGGNASRSIRHWYIRASPGFENNNTIERITYDLEDLPELPENSIIKNSERVSLEQILINAKEAGANYLFGEKETKTNYRNNDAQWTAQTSVTRIEATPFALIGNEEIKILREIFYKEIPRDVKEAMNLLEIESFEGNYKLYSNAPERFIEMISNLRIGDTITNNKKIGKIENFSGDEKVSVGGWSYLQVKDIKLYKKNTLDDHFMNFVFSLAENEQNEETNKKILQLDFFDATNVLLDIYENQKNHQVFRMLENADTKKHFRHNKEKFKKYFDLTTEENRKSLIARLKMLELEEQDLNLNSWLFGKGYDVSIEFLGLYNNDEKGFQRYFENASEAERKNVLNVLFKLPAEKINAEISQWLSDNYSEIVEKTGIKKI